MYYDDQARRFNLLSGLLSGAVLGTGLALLLRAEPVSRTRRVRQAVGALGRSAGRRLEEIREEAGETATDALREGRRRFRL